MREIESRCGPGHVSRATVSNWFSGKHVPDVVLGLTIARIVGYPLDWMADGLQDTPPEPAESGVHLSDDERTILRIARAITPDEAIRRLSYAVGTFEPSSPNPPAPRGEGPRKGDAK